MTSQVLLPKLGNSVESSIIVGWLKQPGDRIEAGETLCTVETDKAAMEVPSTASGVVLQHLANVGDDVPVLSPIAVIGEVQDLLLTSASPLPDEGLRISPRALKLAQQNNLDVSLILGTGPSGRIIERDVQTALTSAPFQGEQIRMTPVAKAMIERGGYVAPEQGSGPGGRVTKQDLVPADIEARHAAAIQTTIDYDVIPLSNIRRTIAERMRTSLQSSAQLTLHASADARALLDYRKRLKTSDESLGLQGVTINDLMLFVVARTLRQFPQLNATFENGELRQFKRVHLGFAVDTPRGLLAPVIRNADAMTLKQLADESSRLNTAAQNGKTAPDLLSGGTFTMTNLGGLGIESFTPILNAPQVAILGVGNINLKAIEVDGEVRHIPHIGLSLTIDHQVVDGAPGARFQQTLARNLAQIELLLAL